MPHPRHRRRPRDRRRLPLRPEARPHHVPREVAALLAPPRVVLFDLDHTILDTDRAERAALRVAAARLDLRWSVRLLEAYRAINADMWRAYQRGEIDPATLSRERFCRLLGQMGKDEAHGGAMGAAYLDAISQRGDVLPGGRATLAAVGRRARVGAVTNGIDRVQHARLKAAGIAHRFEVVVTSESCGFAKPDPRIVQEALMKLGASPDETAYVGDDAHADGGAARAAGVRFWWIDRGLGGQPPVAMEQRLTSVSEVTALLGGNGRA